MKKNAPYRIEFRSIDKTSEFLDPRKGFAPHRESFQVRYDPLTGRSTHYSHIGAITAQKLPIERYSEPEIKGFCPFCLDVRDRVTPKFTGDIVPGGRMVRGESVLIPNLYPYDVYSAVVIMTDDHVVTLDQFDKERLTNAFSLGVDFLKRARELNPALPYSVMAWNYMPPSGGGLVHPHQQYFATGFPGNQLVDEMKASREYFKRHGTDYWTAIVAAEKDAGERYIGTIGSSCWLASYASLGVLGDIQAVFPGIHSTDRFKTSEIHNLVDGLLRVFRYYLDQGIESFNASLFFGVDGQEEFSTHFRIVPRTFLNTRDCAPDLNFYQSLLAEPVSVIYPEDLCEGVRKYF